MTPMRKVGVFFNMPLHRTAEVYKDNNRWVVKTYIRGEYNPHEYAICQSRLEADEWAITWVNLGMCGG